MNLPSHASLKTLLIIFALTVFYTGCKNERLIQPGDSVTVAYKKAMWMYRNKKYSNAVSAFKTVINVGRGTDYGKFGHFYLAQTYFKNEQYLLASEAYKRFLSLYPNAPKADKAQFMEAYSYVKLSPRYRLSQKYTHTAIEKMKIFIDKYPSSKKVEKAAQCITKLRNKLAHKMFHAAELYDRLDQYQAAVTYYELVINQYPETNWAEQALSQQIETYLEYANKSVRWKQVDRYKKAVEGYETYLQLFPQGPHRTEVEDYVSEAREILAQIEPVPEPGKEKKEEKPVPDKIENVRQ